MGGTDKQCLCNFFTADSAFKAGRELFAVGEIDLTCPAR